MSADPERSSPRDVPGAERLLTLSDGVVAIALTLLVLQLRVPATSELADANSAADLAGQLAKDSSQFLSYAVAFYVIAQFWLAHHRLFAQIRGHQEGLAWWNFAFLFTISVMPFTSELLGMYSNNPLAVDIFALNLLLASVSTQVTARYSRRQGLLKPDADERTLATGRTRAISFSAVILVSIGLAWVNTDLAKYTWLLMLVVPRAVARWSRAEAGAAS